MKYAYLYIERNIGHGYVKITPPCNFWKKWIFKNFLFPLAKKKLEITLKNHPENSPILDGILADWSLWHGYYVTRFLRMPDKKCTDPLADGRNPKFFLTIILEGEPELFPPERFYFFIKHCIDIAYDIMLPGINNNLKIEIPSEFFTEE